ncbi:SURF1 family protein [Polaromonas sp. SM01]|uniref:SURF1 family protein n=1 Tax=Polaromonas sp. SM01 TaxID=3085630 RepID=UPI0029817461|nr:SURF1 family protein [Polaromonas sp. SM01]MDW5442111.1 SURF1 family protein [Polaromonas sp. SM01]
MSSRLQTRRFVVLTLAAVLMVALTFSLGQWQLRRAAQKETLQAAIDAQKKLPALDGWALIATKNIADVMHRRAVLQGTWQGAHTVYLDNRPMNGKSGFWVVTPLALTDSGQWILVQRGWVPRDFGDRTRLPAIVTPEGLVSVPGRMAPPPSKLYAFEGADQGRIRQNLDVAAFSAEIGVPLLPASMLQTGAASEGLLRDWPAPNTGVDKHHGYAFQWFGLCALVAGLYVWFQLILPRRSKRHSQHS